MALNPSCSYRFSQKCTSGVPHRSLSTSDRGRRIHVGQVGHQFGVGRLQVRCSKADSASDQAIDFNALSAKYDKPSMANSNYETVTELPPLISSLVNAEGLPAPVRTTSAWEAESQRQLLEVAERWKTDSMKHWIPMSVLACCFIYGQAVSLDRLVGLSLVVTVEIMLDDLLFDCPNDSLLEEFGIDGAVRESPETIMAYLRHLCGVYDRDAPLKKNPAAIEGLMWECGDVMRRFSNPEWFAELSAARMTQYESSVASEVDRFHQCQDLQAFSVMRRGNGGGDWIVLLLEYSMNAYLPRAIRLQPVFAQLLERAILYIIFTNDVLSYAREVVEEPDNPRNLVKMMVDVEGMTLPEAAWRAVDIINAHACAVMELENQLLACDEATPGVRAWAYELKLMMIGNIYFHVASKRYHVRGSVFPEFELQ